MINQQHNGTLDPVQRETLRHHNQRGQCMPTHSYSIVIHAVLSKHTHTRSMRQSEQHNPSTTTEVPVSRQHTLSSWFLVCKASTIRSAGPGRAFAWANLRGRFFAQVPREAASAQDGTCLITELVGGARACFISPIGLFEHRGDPSSGPTPRRCRRVWQLVS